MAGRTRVRPAGRFKVLGFFKTFFLFLDWALDFMDLVTLEGAGLLLLLLLLERKATFSFEVVVLVLEPLPLLLDCFPLPVFFGEAGLPLGEGDMAKAFPRRSLGRGEGVLVLAFGDSPKTNVVPWELPSSSPLPDLERRCGDKEAMSLIRTRIEMENKVCPYSFQILKRQDSYIKIHGNKLKTSHEEGTSTPTSQIKRHQAWTRNLEHRRKEFDCFDDVQLASIQKPSHPVKSWLASPQLQRGQTGKINLSYQIPLDCLATARWIDRPKYGGICSPTGLFFSNICGYIVNNAIMFSEHARFFEMYWWNFQHVLVYFPNILVYFPKYILVYFPKIYRYILVYFENITGIFSQNIPVYFGKYTGIFSKYTGIFSKYTGIFSQNIPVYFQNIPVYFPKIYRYIFPKMHRTLGGNENILVKYTGIFWKYTGIFWKYIGIFWENIPVYFENIPVYFPKIYRYIFKIYRYIFGKYTNIFLENIPIYLENIPIYFGKIYHSWNYTGTFWKHTHIFL